MTKQAIGDWPDPVFYSYPLIPPTPNPLYLPVNMVLPTMGGFTVAVLDSSGNLTMKWDNENPFEVKPEGE